MKSVRFAEVVKRCGRPFVHALWAEPDRDPEFVRARKADRVLTLERSERGKAEYGIVGFDRARDRHGQFLIFPRSLKPYAGTRVVGVKYELVDQPPPLVASEFQPWQPRRRPKPSGTRPKATTHSEPASPNPSSQSSDRAPTQPPPRANRRAPRSVKHRRSGNSPPDGPHLASRQTRSTSPPSKSLADEVRAALDEMRRGESVAAYERLRSAVEGAGTSHGRK